MQDSSTVSNEWHELKTVADKFGIRPSEVLKAKEETGSNNREVIEQHLASKSNTDLAIVQIQQALDMQKQAGNFNFSPYMLGMANGLIFSLATLRRMEPEYLKEPVEGFLIDREPRKPEQWDINEDPGAKGKED